MIPNTFKKGDRVVLSEEGVVTLLDPIRSIIDPKRMGTITGFSRSQTSSYVLWDGRRAHEAYHNSFLEKVIS